MIRKGCGCLLFFPLIICVLFALFFLTFKSPNNFSDYKKEYLDETLELAQSTADRFGLFTSVVLAQSALESDYGRSLLSLEYNNYFGIKARSNEDSVVLKTNEVINGQTTSVNEAFKKYLSKSDSFNHYGKLISQSKRYKKVKEARDFREASQYLQDAGYATDNHYAEKIIAIVEKYHLGQFDRPNFWED